MIDNIGFVDVFVNLWYFGIVIFVCLFCIEDVLCVDIVVVGILFDFGVSYCFGICFGLLYVWEFLWLLCLYNLVQDVFLFQFVQVVDVGDIFVNFFDFIEVVIEVECVVLVFGEQVQCFVMIGGDYMVVFFLLCVVVVKYGFVVVLYFDVYLDMWDIYFGVFIMYGIFFWCVSEEGLIDFMVSCYVGICGFLYFKQDFEDDECFGFFIVFSEYIEEYGVEVVIDCIFIWIGDRLLYVLIDIDVFDFVYVFGIGMLEVGGFMSCELLCIFCVLCDCDIVGVDVVEVLFVYDYVQMIGIVVSYVVYELVIFFVV